MQGTLVHRAPVCSAHSPLWRSKPRHIKQFTQPTARARLTARSQVTTAMAPVECQECDFTALDEGFHELVVGKPAQVIAKRDYDFAHEGPTYLRATNQLLFTSNRLGDKDSTDQHIEVAVMDLETHEVQVLQPDPPIMMANGSTKAIGSDTNVILCYQGKGDTGGGLVHLDTQTQRSTILVDSFKGHSFNSPNDVIFHKDGTIWFTDPPYGYEQNFRTGQPELGPYVYVFDPSTGKVATVGDGFDKPNGICFNQAYTICYITDSAMPEDIEKDLPGLSHPEPLKGSSTDPGEPADTEGQEKDERIKPRCVWAFDVDKDSDGSYQLKNRRVFAVAKKGAPDGIHMDERDNVWLGTGTGVEIIDPQGKRLGHINLPNGGISNFCIGANKQLLLLQEDHISMIELKVAGAPLP